MVQPLKERNVISHSMLVDLYQSNEYAHLLKINEAIIVRVPVVEISCKIVFVIKGSISVLNEIKNIELRTELL